MSKNWKLIHIKSKQCGEDNLSPKLPTCDQLEYGEIAINYGKGIETIAIKNENDEIVKFIPEKRIKEYINEEMKNVASDILKMVEEKIEAIFSPGSSAASIDSGEY